MAVAFSQKPEYTRDKIAIEITNRHVLPFSLEPHIGDTDVIASAVLLYVTLESINSIVIFSLGRKNVAVLKLNFQFKDPLN